MSDIDDTTSYISSVIQQAPKKKLPGPTQGDFGTPVYSWASSVSGDGAGSRTANRRLSCMLNSFLTGLNIFVIFVGLGVFGAAMYFNNTAGALPDLFRALHFAFVIAVAVAAVFVVVGIIGLVSTKVRVRGILGFYIAVLIFFLLIVLAVLVVFIVFAFDVSFFDNSLEASLRNRWETLDAADRCSIQSHFRCSGFDVACNTCTFTPSFTQWADDDDDNQYLAAAAVASPANPPSEGRCAQCVECADGTNAYTTPCVSAAHSAAKHFMIPMVIVFSVVALAILLALGLSIVLFRARRPKAVMDQELGSVVFQRMPEM
eukprot:TRINITY_DN2732_c0_g1_i1.p1 TRINITY_DN2732_c0_g1~~TRINITY_DN2732_c0_g1_i1.p1  ORF type:complete len:317 (-),score=47.67 TRINITY_DN2732_c0_g1_i1:316-1266(-)